MDTQFHDNYFERRCIFRSRAPAVRWVKEWVSQDVVATGGKCSLFKWVTDIPITGKHCTVCKACTVLITDSAKCLRSVVQQCVNFSLSLYEGCGKTFIDAGALRKHSHIHGERQYVCHYEGCGKKFLDSSKLKRHFLIHTGERDFVCPHEGCGKAFSLDFNLRSHMKTHSQENYHICPYPDCGKRYAHEYKLKNHISSHHEKNVPVDLPKYAVPPPEKQTRTPKTPAGVYGSASSDRPYACPYEGCEKAYIHEYKLKLHLRREHPGHMSDENAEHAPNTVDNEMDEASDQDVYAVKRVNGKSQKTNRAKPNLKFPLAKVHKGLTPSQVTKNAMKKPWPVKVIVSEDSEETEEDRDNEEDGWRYVGNNDDDEETEYED